MCVIFLLDLQDKGTHSYTGRYPELPSTSYNSFYNSQYRQFLSPKSPNTNSGHKYNFVNTCATDNQQLATSSHHTPSATPVQYCTSTYANSHLGHSNYGKPVSPAGVVFPDLSSLTNEELKKIGEDGDSLDSFLEEHCQLSDINLAIDEAIDYVEKMTSKSITFFIFRIILFPLGLTLVWSPHEGKAAVRRFSSIEIDWLAGKFE